MKLRLVLSAVCLACCLTNSLLAQNRRVGVDQKGSLLFYSKIELRWNSAGTLVQDTVLSLLNDYAADVRVQLYFVNGDRELDPVFSSGPIPILIAEGEPGWNFADCAFTLTPDQPVYWSAATGNPLGCQPFEILDPDLGFGPGRPDPEGSTDRVLRGFVIGWAVDNIGNEIYWNHLSGKATIINYADFTAWEYSAWAFQSRVSTATLPIPIVIHPLPGVLNMDGLEYDQSFDVLLFDFFGAGSFAFSRGGTNATVDTDLTLHLLSGDFRENSVFPFNPASTKAHFDIWNMNERKLSNTRRCITCWDQTLISNYGIPNNMRVMNLQTDKGKARIDGKQANECEENCFRDERGDIIPLRDIVELLGDLLGDVEIRCSLDVTLLGVAAKHISFAGGDRSVAGETLVGMGTQSARLVYEDPPCDDGLFCNGEEEFDIFTGLCTGIPPCFPHVDGCATYTGGCSEDLDECDAVLNDAACSDGVFCNGVERCEPDNPAANNFNCFRPGPPCALGQFCDELLGRCVDCLNDTHCADTPATPFCKVVSGTCVECIQPGQCDDDNSCTTDTCVVNSCVNDRECDTVADCPPNLCAVVSCSPDGCCGAVSACPPTIGGCSNVVGCDPTTGDCITQNEQDGTACNIADNSTFCTGAECDGICVSGTCVECEDGTDCDDSNDCTTDTCTNGVCSNPTVPNGSTCDDDNACTTGDDCQGGVCGGDPTIVCVSPPTCRGPVACDPATGGCPYPVAPDGTACDNGDGCDGTDTCVLGACTPTGGPVVCTALDQCHEIGICDPATGICTNPQKADDTPCDDQDPCTGPDTCQSGQCVGATGTEICNGIDDDCNGPIDDVAGIGDPCTGDGTNTAGECDAEYRCDPGNLGSGPGGLRCTQTVFPTTEVCDGLDNDCNGAADENIQPINCGVGECARTANCLAGSQDCTPGTPTAETCNGLDDDCDGAIDDGACGPNSTCTGGPSCVCDAGFLDCDGTSATGCEVNSQTDVDHCGGCNQPCPSGTGCVGGMCQLLAQGQTCSANDQCSTGNCVDAVCCDVTCTGICEACDLAGALGTCTDIPSGQDPDSECPGATTCDGAGNCFQVNGTACVASAQCQSGSCVDGVCCNSACMGTCQACSTALTGGTNGVCANVSAGGSDPPGCAVPSTCNGSGQCSQAGGASCTTLDECLSGFCVDGFCCDTDCTGLCQSCASADTGGTDGVCANVQSGLDPDDDCTDPETCDGAGNCSGGPNGAACTTSGQCNSGICADNVCCNTACTDECVGCNLAGGPPGTCAFVPNGLDDSDTCTPTSTMDCDGAGLCKLTEGQSCTTSAECASGHCVDGVCCNEACSGLCEACTAAIKGGGSDGFCGDIAVNTDPGDECFAACDGTGECQGVNGQACSQGTECDSGLCIDGVCCNTACTVTCQACNLAGSLGTCTNIPANTDPHNECAGGDCNGAGACEQANGAACTQSTQCASGFCVDGVCCDTGCAGVCRACDVAGSLGTCTLIPAGTDPDSECPGANTCKADGTCSP